MSIKSTFLKTRHVLLFSSLSLLVACGGGSSDSNNNTSTSTETEQTSTDQTLSAKYNVTFDATWSAATHPTNFPSGAHFSPMAVVSHNSQVILWEGGQLASTGTKNIAETGSTSSFVSEANDAISAGKALDVEIGAGGFDSPGSQTVTIDMNSEFPQVTFLSMIAPSPDWIGGAHVNNLLTSDGFADSLTVDVMAYDAGTDSGKQYRSANLATNPRDVIQALITDPADASFTSAAQQKIGTLTFIKQ